MKILLTGGAGYIGTSLTSLLLKEGYQVRIIDNLLFGGDSILPFFRSPNFEFIKGDIRNKADMEEALKGQDMIVHLAAIVGYPACRKEPQLAESVNVAGTKLLSSLCSKDQIIFYGSTGSNYGSVEVVCTEETPLNPLSLYGQTKTLAEQFLLDNNRTVAFRFATAFGISSRLRLDLLINDFTYKAVTQGYLVVYEKHFKRTFIHVYDIARSFLFAIQNADKMVNQVYNVGSNKMNFTKEDICLRIMEKTKAYVHFADIGEDADKRNYEVSYNKVNKLGYETTVSIEEGIDELIKASKAIQFRTPYTNI
jgi:nucleoside-diphosphate-sugar epimerase